MSDKPERTIKVRMREGMVMPLPSEIVRNSSTFICTSEQPLEVVLDHRFTRRRLESGDFEIVDGDASELGLPESSADAARKFPSVPYESPPPNTDVDLMSGTIREPALFDDSDKG